jgi:hypothetical protein
MGRELTRQYSSFTDGAAVAHTREHPSRAYSFLRDVYRSGKIRELLSFVAWETFHRLGLFSRDKYLTFRDSPPLILDSATSDCGTLDDRVSGFFDDHGLRAIRATHNWKLLFSNASTGELYGCIYPDDRDLYRSSDDGQSIQLVHRFPDAIKSLFVSSRNTLFVCVKGTVYRGSAADGRFVPCLSLSTPESFFRHNNEMTETSAGALIIGEYGNVWDASGWRAIPYLYFSDDDGATWVRSDFLIEAGINKHVHIVRYSHLLNNVFMADGDNKKKFWVTDALTLPALGSRAHWRPINKFHIQIGGYTSIAESRQRVLLGTDYQGGTNFIVATEDGRSFTKRVVPDPYRRSPIDNMVARKARVGSEVWANLPYGTATTRCLLMFTADGGHTWTKGIDYSGRAHRVWLLNSSRTSSAALYFSIQHLATGNRAVFAVTDR